MCDTIETDKKKGQVNKKLKQHKSKTNRNLKINLPLDSKNNQEMDYIVAGLEKETGMVASTKIIKELQKKYSNFS